MNYFAFWCGEPSCLRGSSSQMAVYETNYSRHLLTHTSHRLTVFRRKEHPSQRQTGARKRRRTRNRAGSDVERLVIGRSRRRPAAAFALPQSSPDTFRSAVRLRDTRPRRDDCTSVVRWYVPYDRFGYKASISVHNMNSGGDMLIRIY